MRLEKEKEKVILEEKYQKELDYSNQVLKMGYLENHLDEFKLKFNEKQFNYRKIKEE